MPVSSVTLTGRAKTGILPPQFRAKWAPLVAPLPDVVKLGRKPPSPGRKGVDLAKHVDLKKGRGSIPTTTNWRGAAKLSIGQMFGNDTHGDCVLADRFHAHGTATANDPDSGGEVIGTREEALAAYRTICGPGDNGCVIEDVLRYQMQRGITIAGKLRKLGGFVRVDWNKPDLVKWTIANLGGCVLGVNLPGAWTGTDVWDVTNSGVVGGHDIWAVDFGPEGIYVCSWARLYRVTWAALAQRGRFDEADATLDDGWTGRDGIAATGLHVEALAADLATIGGGDVPDDPAPPPPPPPPPYPNTLGFDVNLDVTLAGQKGTIRGTVTPRAVGGGGGTDDGDQVEGDEHLVDCQTDELAFALAELLALVPGVAATSNGAALTVGRVGLTPEQWRALIAWLMGLLPIIFGAGDDEPAGGTTTERAPRTTPGKTPAEGVTDIDFQE